MTVLTMGSLPLGFRFRPTDEELINHYLRLKVNGRDSEVEVIPEVDVCKWEPWDLPGLSVIKADDPEWFFFCPRDRKYPNGLRSNRATDAGYWKATGKDRTIRSRKSGSNTCVGMKKTLVFYRGRAPKGERTHWIMHEYRATEEDLQANKPGQSAFVLCRLFRKSDEKNDVVKYHEAEQTESPDTNKLSPDDASSDLVQETTMSDCVTLNAAAPGESCCNSHLTSDVEDHSTEGTAAEEYPVLAENSNQFMPPINGQIDYKIFSPMQSQINAQLASYLDSPYASDFGNDNYGSNFLDGTSEQDASLTELLDEVFNGNDEFTCEESTDQKLAVESEMLLPGQIHMSEMVSAGSFHVKNEGEHSDTDVAHVQQHDLTMVSSGWYNNHLESKELLQQPSHIGSCLAEVSFSKLGKRSIGEYGNNSAAQVASSADSAMGSFFSNLSDVELSTTLENPVNHGDDFAGGIGTGIEIRTRQPQQRPNSYNFANQGTAPRRLRLQVKPSPAPVDDGEEKDASHSKEEDEVQSGVTEINKTAEESHFSDDETDGGNQVVEFDKSGEITEESSTKLRSRVKRGGESDISEIKPFMYTEAPSTHPDWSSSLGFQLSVVIVIIFSIICIGIWRCSIS